MWLVSRHFMTCLWNTADHIYLEPCDQLLGLGLGIWSERIHRVRPTHVQRRRGRRGDQGWILVTLQGFR